MIEFTEDGVYMLSQLAAQAPSGLRVVPEVCWRLSESDTSVIETGWNGEEYGGVGRTSWYKGIRMMERLKLIVKVQKGMYRVDPTYIKKSSPKT